MFSFSKSLICASLLLSGSFCMAGKTSPGDIPSDISSLFKMFKKTQKCGRTPSAYEMKEILKTYYKAKIDAEDELKEEGYLPDTQASQARRAQNTLRAQEYNRFLSNTVLPIALVVGGVAVTAYVVHALIKKGKKRRRYAFRLNS